MSPAEESPSRARYERALETLPAPYALALRLRDGGASERELSLALGVDVSAVRSLLRIAESKLQAALEAGDGFE